MKSLILGGNGFLGSHLVDKLLAEGHAVRVFDKYEEHYRAPLANVDYRYGDFGNRGLLADAIQGIDTVFHLISTTLPKTSNDDPVFDVQSNVVETLFMLEQCVAQKIRKIIFISSGGTVYGAPDVLPVTEDCPTEPLCSYGVTKLTIEKYLALYNNLHGLDYVVLRPSNPYGDRQNPTGIQGAISVFLTKIAKGETIEIWGDGSVVRDYLYIDDLASGICMSATANVESRIFNLGSGHGTSLNELIETIRNIVNIDVKVEYRPGRAFDVPQIYLDISRARKELGWEPTISLESGIKKTWEFVQRVAA